MKRIITVVAASLALSTFSVTHSNAAFPLENIAVEEAMVLSSNLSDAVSVSSEAALESTVSEENIVASSVAKAGDNQWIALILCIVVGGLGIHRFYLGYTWQGIVQLLTLGGLGVWVIIDLIRIAIGDLQPKDGSYSTTI